MLKKIFKFINGYVIIEISGKNKERFINMCLYNMLGIYDVIPYGDKLRLKTNTADFKSMRRLVRKSGVRLRIVSKHGLRRHLYRYRHRYGFALSGLAVCIFFLLLPQYILCVEIDGAYNADSGAIMDILREHGVYTGARKSGIDDLTEIKNAVVFGVDGVNWAWLYDEGARMRLQIQESKPVPKMRTEKEPTDIIAACDGWVTSADIYHGERRVNAGMAVTAGQTLVSGKVAVFKEGYPEKYIYVHSDAKIIADTIRAAEGSFKNTETLRIKTGETKKRFTVTLFGRDFNLYRDISCGFKDYDLADNRKHLDIPVIGYTGISITTHEVAEINEVTRGLLEEKICRKLGTGAVKTDEKLSYKENKNGFRVELRMYLKENIGIEIPIEE